jgi:hypothetical protein
VRIYFNGSTSAGSIIGLTGTIGADGVFVLADNDAAAAILAVANQTATNNFFNGDDAIELLFDGVVMDSIGQVGFDPGSEWGTGLVSTQDHTLRRLASVFSGDPISNNPFDPSNEWAGFAQDTFDGLGSHQLQSSAVPEASTLAVWVLLGLCCSGSHCWRLLRGAAALPTDAPGNHIHVVRLRLSYRSSCSAV